MPQPIHIQDARLAQYLRLFSGVFSLPQWKYFVTVLLGCCIVMNGARFPRSCVTSRSV